MALDGEKLGAQIYNSMKDRFELPDDGKEVWEIIGIELVDYILNNLQVQIPAGDVITAVSGGSGAPAVGAPNNAALELDVS